uniref:phosphatidylserine decarboxylase n=1 Tax=Rhodosorus marinus TaxID=101924 RepID=A0A6T6MJ28_9RHOD
MGRRLRRLGLITLGSLTGGSAWYYWRFCTASSNTDDSISHYEQNVYRALPLRFFSRVVGQAAQVRIPSVVREPLYGSFCKATGCKLEEAEKAANEYRNFSEFFCRRLKEGVRPISHAGVLVSPCDGQIVSCGRVAVAGRIEQVKGRSFGIREFLHAEDDEPIAIGPVNVGTSAKGEVQASKSSLYYVNIYLEHGAYHCFHSPVDWQLRKRRHVSGNLLSLLPNVLRRVPDVVNENERVVLMGKWNHGLFAMVPVGATGVGSIELKFDDELETNRFYSSKGDVKLLRYASKDRNFIDLTRGEFMGRFKLGSSIVLIFEAPSDLNLGIAAGDKLLQGQPIGS